MNQLAGPSGEVTTVDIDAFVTERAQRFLARAGYDRVNVVTADAEEGASDYAPFDRIIVTAGSWDIPPSWTRQLSPTGKIIVPLRMRSLSRSVALTRDGDHLVSLDHRMAGFVHMQGAGAHQDHTVGLHGDDVVLRFDDPDSAVDAEELHVALQTSRVETWSGVYFGGSEPFDGLFLWLATSRSDYCLISRGRSKRARSLVDPASPIGTPALVSEDSFAYLTFRKATTEGDAFEFGAHAYGPQARQFAAALCDHVTAWDRDHRAGPPARIFVYPASTPATELPAGRVIPKRHSTVVITWL